MIPYLRKIHIKEIIKKLRDPVSGCPWDLEQTHRSIRQYLVEETYETIEAIDAEDDKELCSELGDVLLQVMLHSQIAADRDAFQIEDVIEKISEKMVRRHPHVFGDAKVNSSQDVKKNWEEIKRTEQADTSFSGLLKSVPKALPGLIRAKRLGGKAQKAGFDWEDEAGVWAKIEEERKELVEAKNKKEFEHELGDLLFALSQLARWRGVSAEDCLRSACQRFTDRFEETEKIIGSFEGKSIDEMEAAWQKAKEKLS